MSTAQSRIVLKDIQIIYDVEPFSQATQNEDHRVDFQWPFANEDVIIVATLRDPGFGTATPSAGIGTRNVTAKGFSALIKSETTGYSSEFSWIAIGTLFHR